MKFSFGLPVLLVSVLLQAGAAWAHHPVRGDAAAGREVSKACLACHGGDRMAAVPGFPSLTGQNESYLIKQLVEMRRSAQVRVGTAAPRPPDVEKLLGTARSNEIMDPFVINLTDKDIENVAAYYSSLPCDARKQAPAPLPVFETRCQVCHGKDGLSPSPHLPNLAGQNYDYLLAQLYQFKAASEKTGDEKRRRAAMESQVRTLSDDDIRAVAKYYASLTCSH